MTNKCRVDRCKYPSNVRKLCNRHYRILRETGSLKVSPSETMTIEVKPCTIESCERASLAKGLCALHYNRNYHFGDPLLTANPALPQKSTAERFWEHVDKSEDCWLWTGATDEYGKGRFRFDDGIRRPAHRYSYIQHHNLDTLPKGELIRQLCREPACVNPEHLARAAETEYHYDAPVTTLRESVN